jgi:hypothetical protein
MTKGVTVSGQFGAIGDEDTVQDWNLTLETNPPQYRASNTRLGTGRVKGIEDWTGTFNQYRAVPNLFPGGLFTFQGYTGPDSLGVGGDGTLYTGNAIVNQVVITWNWQNNEIIQSSTSFQGVNFLTVGSGLIQDPFIPRPPTICGVKVRVSGGSVGAETDWPNVSQATLTFTTDNPEFINSSTYDEGTGKCYVGRVPGPLDYTLDIQEDSTESFVGISDDVIVKLFVDATRFWEMKWCHVGSHSDINVNIESGEVVRQTANLLMNGFYDNQIGQVIDPNLNQVWPKPGFPPGQILP